MLFAVCCSKRFACSSAKTGADRVEQGDPRSLASLKGSMFDGMMLHNHIMYKFLQHMLHISSGFSFQQDMPCLFEYLKFTFSSYFRSLYIDPLVTRSLSPLHRNEAVHFASFSRL